jgi:hypothetical protein
MEIPRETANWFVGGWTVPPLLTTRRANIQSHRSGIDKIIRKTIGIGRLAGF